MKKILTLGLSILTFSAAQAQTDAPRSVRFVKKTGKVGKVYFGINMDSYMLTSSNFDNGTSSKLTVPRFTAFFHVGTSAHYNFNSKVGLVSGLGIKNIGFIEKINNPDSTVIRRNYTIGIPLGVKFGNMFGTYGMIGGGVDIPFHYKEKGFVKRSNKTKTNEWFSQRTASVMPYVFVGARFNPGLYVKAQYYPTNFMNSDYKTTVNGNVYQPYQNYNVNLFMLSLGIDITYRPKYD